MKVHCSHFVYEKWQIVNLARAYANNRNNLAGALSIVLEDCDWQISDAVQVVRFLEKIKRLDETIPIGIEPDSFEAWAIEGMNS